MANIVSDTTSKVKDFWNKQGKKKRTTVLIAAAVIIAAIALLIFSLTRKDFVVLFSGLDAAEAGEVYQVLKDDGVSVKAEGNSILVPKNQVEELRLSLNAQGYPKSGLNYDVFQKASSLGATDMDKNVYLKFQLEQNIMQTIKRLDRVKNATVMITLQQDSQFALSGVGNTPATASVVVDLKNSNDRLTASEAATIRNIVMRSVPNLSAENITIADSNMNLYDQGVGDISADSNTQMELQQKTKQNLENQINNILTPIFGAGKMKSSVNVILDFDKRVTTSVKFEPPIEGEEQGFIVSQSELMEQISGGNNAGGTVGVDPNTGVTTYPEGSNAGNGDYLKTTRQFNAEINETKEQIESAQGQIKELSVAVIIDDEQSADELLPQITDLVSKAIGVEENNISVLFTTFKENEAIQQQMQEAQDAVKNQSRNAMIKNIVILVAIIAAVIAIFIIIKKRWKKDGEIVATRAGGATSGGVNLFADEDLDISDLQSGEAENTAKIKKLIKSDPEAVSQLLRNWLSDDYGR